MSSEVIKRLDDIDVSLRALVAGLRQQSLVLAQQSAALTEIMSEVAGRAEDDSLGEVLRRLVALCERNEGGIARIEAQIFKMHA